MIYEGTIKVQHEKCPTCGCPTYNGLVGELTNLKTERDNLAEQLDTQKKMWVLRSASLHKTIDELKKKARE